MPTPAAASQLFSLLLLALAPPAAADVINEIVLRNGAPAPGLEGATSMLRWIEPQVNESGQIAFEATTLPSGASGVWVHSNNLSQFAIGEGMQAPGTEEDLRSFISLFFDEGGRVAVQASLESGKWGNWAGTAGTVALAHREGDPAPVANSQFNSFPVIESFNDGKMTWVERIKFVTQSGERDRQGIWFGSPGEISIAGFEQEQSPVALLVYSRFGDPLVNDNGEIAFEFSTLPTSDSFFAVGEPGRLGWIGGVGIPAPGTPGTFTGYTLAGYNNAGDVCFLSAGRVDEPLQFISGIWVANTNEITELAIQGTQAPGLEGIEFESFLEACLAGNRNVAFFARVTGGGVDNFNRNVIYAGTPEGIGMCARVGDRPPSAEEGTTFSLFPTPRCLFVNSNGVVAFLGKLTGPGVNLNNDLAIYAGRPGAIELVMREGNMVETEPGTVRRVRELSFLKGVAGTQGGQPTCLNDKNELVFAASLNGANALFRATIIPGGGVTFADWADGFGLTGNDAAPGSDADFDGNVTGIEFALGTDPTDPSSRDEPEVTIDDQGRLLVCVNRPPGIQGVTYAVQTSSDLTPGSWTASGTNVIEDSPTTLKVRIDSNPNGVYARLAVTVQ